MSSVTVPTGAARSEIQRSWERSAMCGLTHESELKLPYDPELGGEERFLRAAGPVLEHVGTFLDGSRTSVVLMDARGRLIARKCGETTVLRMLDRTFSAPGFTWSEEFSGTTAVSIALEERMPCVVTSGEHYLEALKHLVCAAVPITHPITRRLLGVIDVTSRVDDASLHMFTVVRQAAAAIEERIYEDSSAVERALLSQFLATSSRPGRHALVLGERVELSTPPAARLLSVEDRTLLWERASEIIKTRQTAQEDFTLADGRTVPASFERIEVGGRPAGVVIELEPTRTPTARTRAARSERRAASARPAGFGLPGCPFLGRSSVAQHLRRQVEELRHERVPVLVCGEAGVGKLTLAKAIAGPDCERVLLDAALAAVDGESALLRQVSAMVAEPGRTVIVRRIGHMSAQGIDALRAIALTAEEHGARVITTATLRPTTSPDDPVADAAEAFAVRVEVPPLRERTADLIDIVPHLVERRGATSRVAPEVIQSLMRYDWPGNVRELDGLVRMLLTRKRTTDIVLADLPPAYRGSSMRLRRIEAVERAAITQALIEVGGNKSRAAEVLGIGRATLYRKIRAYGLDLEVCTS